MGINWIEVRVVVDGEAAEAVAELLRPFAYDQSVVIEQLGDMTRLEEDALEPQVTVKIYLPQDDQTAAVCRHIEESLYFLGRLYPIPAPTFHVLQEEDWANAWKVHYHPFRVGKRLWIQPSWQKAEGVEGTDLLLTLDPGMAFGTGLHPTTQMCLQALEELVKPGVQVLDLGTGSGILAIAAAKLGAASVLGLDIDSIAVQTAIQNVQENGVAGQVMIQTGGIENVPAHIYNLVVVNILAPVIIQFLRQHNLLSYLARDGFLVLSGIIDQQLAEVEAAVRENAGIIIQTLTIRDWAALIVQHQQQP